MIFKSKKYFTLFGILAATVDKKMHSIYSSINTILSTSFPFVLILLLLKELKPKKLYVPKWY